jgi:hypothetical protein
VFDLFPVAMAASPSLTQSGDFVAESSSSAGQYIIIDQGNGSILVTLTGGVNEKNTSTVR